MAAIKSYLEIQKISFLRYWKAFPVLLRLLGIIALLAFSFLLYKIQINYTDIRTSAIAVVVFMALTFNFSFSKSQKILLRNYNISIRRILFFKAGLLTIPFFILNPVIGCACLVAAAIISILQPDKVSIKRGVASFKPSYPFRKSSFQWISFYRQAGFYIHLISVFLMIMGIIHNNANLCMVSFLFSGAVIGIGSSLEMEPLYFVKAYSGPASLLRKKAMEVVFNLSILMIPMGMALVCARINIGMLAYIFMAVITLSLVSILSKYANYPDNLRSLLLTSIWLVITALSLVLRSWFLLAVPLIIVFLYYQAYQHLMKLYKNDTE